MTTPLETCGLRPFLSKVVTSRASPEQTASSVHIFVQQLELWLRQLKEAICADLTACCNSGPGGVTKFTELSDVPNSYVGEVGKLLRVNATETALEFFTQVLVTAFLQLSDTPNSYAGSAGFYVRVNAGATALEFFDLVATLVTTFLQLTDTPSSYSGAALKALRVNAAANAVEFFVQALTLLSDFPATYAGAGLKGLRVNAGATAVEFFTQLFTLLGDVPTSYSGQAGKIVVVNSTETGLEFSGGNGPESPTATQVGKIRSLVLPSVGATFVIGDTQSNSAAGGISNVMSSASFLGSTYRSTLKSAAGAGSSSGVRIPRLLVSRGSAAGSGGFRFSARWATSTAVAQQRSFVGVHNLTTEIGNVNPSTLLDLFGVSYNSAGGQLLLTYNDGAGAATQDAINGGTGFPVDATTIYELVFSCAPNTTTIEYIIRNLSTGLSEAGQKTTNLPTNTLFLAPHMWVNNGTTATAVQIDLIYMQLELYG